MAEGQAALTQIAGVAREVGPGVWRSDGGISLLQISASGSTTRFAASTTRGVIRWSMIFGGTAVGGFLGARLAGLLTIALGGEVSSMALAIASGGVTGLLSGCVIGASVWKATARTIQSRLSESVERMRSAAEGEQPEDPPDGGG